MITRKKEKSGAAGLKNQLMDLESFLAYKRIFVEKLDEKQLDRYWRSISD